MGKVIQFQPRQKPVATRPSLGLVLLRGEGWQMEVLPWLVPETLEHFRAVRAGKAAHILPISMGELDGVIWTLEEYVRMGLN